MENSYLSRAREMMEEIRANRRTIHEYAELAFDLPQTVALVMKELKSYGYEPKLCGKAGVTCTVGKPGKCILLRADMDALPMYEKTGLPFASKNKSCHSCGHDSHTAMLLAAAKMLKEREDELEGTVKFMFQPDEEDLAGAKDMIRGGVIHNQLIAVISLLEFCAAMYFTAVCFRKALVFDPSRPTDDGPFLPQKPLRQKNGKRR